MENFRFTVGRMYFNSVFGKCVCVSTKSKKHPKAPIKMLQVFDDSENGLEAKEIYLDDSGKDVYTHDFSSFIPFDMFDMRLIPEKFYAGRRYWIPEMGDVMLCARDVDADTIGVIRWNSKSLHVVNLTSSGRLHRNDRYPTLLKDNPFTQDRIIRHSGKTTRIIDDLIQQFFNDDNVTIFDHHHTQRSQKSVMKKFLDRLEMEHHMIIDTDIIIDTDKNMVLRK